MFWHSPFTIHLFLHTHSLSHPCSLSLCLFFSCAQALAHRFTHLFIQTHRNRKTLKCPSSLQRSRRERESESGCVKNQWIHYRKNRNTQNENKSRLNDNNNGKKFNQHIELHKLHHKLQIDNLTAVNVYYIRCVCGTENERTKKNISLSFWLDERLKWSFLANSFSTFP